jgi:hypothetical protein
MGPSKGPASAFTTTATAARPPDASRHASSLRETGQPLAAIEPIGVSGDGCPRLHPTTKLVLPQVTTIHTFSGRAKLCFIRDEKSRKDFLVDTGAAISLLPFQSAAGATGPQLQAVNKQAIKTWNFVNTAVKFNSWEYTFAFLRADVPFPIVGLDFLRYFGMQVNPSSPAILIAPSQHFQEGGTAGGEDLISSHVSARKEAQEPQLIAAAGARPIHSQVMKMLQEEFPQLLRPSTAAPQLAHGVVHHILTNGRPVFAKARRLEPAKCCIAEEEFAALEKACIVSRSTSPWASPLHMVPKKDGSWQPCGDYRRLNTITVPDRYPLPNMLDLSANMVRVHRFQQNRPGQGLPSGTHCP